MEPNIWKINKYIQKLKVSDPVQKRSLFPGTRALYIGPLSTRLSRTIASSDIGCLATSKLTHVLRVTLGVTMDVDQETLQCILKGIPINKPTI